MGSLFCLDNIPMTALKYCLFAAVATILNLLSQFVVFSIYTGVGSLYLGIFCGTAAGLVSKYILDKKYVFDYQSNSNADELRNFSLYSLFGIVTTLIFWGTEVLFDALSQNPNSRYAGAVVGLGIGYLIKYQLDKHYVFNEIRRPEQISAESKSGEAFNAKSISGETK